MNVPGTFDKRVLLFQSIICIAVLFVSCQSKLVIYSQLEEIGKEGWSVDDPIKFAFQAPDTGQLYDLNLDVSHAKDYAWQNLYVQIETNFPGDSLKTDVLSLELADGFGGWEGRCTGEECRVTIPLRRSFKFPVPGEYTLTFRQYMRLDVVPGIIELKLTVVESTPENGH